MARSEGLEAAKLRSPRRTFNVASSSYLLEARTGGLKLPELDAEGDRWDAQLPAHGITWHDAVAYCAWRSVREGRECRLPSEEEWEKAARGVDGRWYPWGNRFDPSLGNMNLSRRRPAPATVGEFPRDVSVYGVAGLAGNVMDWTSTELVSGTDDSRRAGRVFRGGSWGSVMRNCRAARRDWHGPSRVYGYLGFRIARSLR